MSTHAVKCWPQYYEAVVSNEKPFELRIGDRPYAVGDLFVAQEWNPQSQQYTGRQCVRVITYVGRNLPGLLSWHVALGLRELSVDTDAQSCAAAADLLLEIVDTIEESRATTFECHSLDGVIPDDHIDAREIVAYLDDWLARVSTWMEHAE